jgi:hypothetical protein
MIWSLLSLLIGSLFGRRLIPTEMTPSAHPLGPDGDDTGTGLEALPVGIVSHAPDPAPAHTSDLPDSLQPIVAAMKRLGYKVFENDALDLNLNIVGIRNPSARLDKFDCTIHVFWKYAGQWEHKSWPITTFPGSRYLVEKLLNPRGAAILVPGQYLGVYALDLHGGRYRALCQRNGAVNVYRDGDRDRVFDLEPATIQNGSFGINIHAPQTIAEGVTKSSYIADRVYAASAGCQVFQRSGDFLIFRSICDAAVKVHGNQFSYTLLTTSDLDEVTAPPAPARPAEVTGGLWDPPFSTTGVRNKNVLNVKGDGWMYSLGRDDRGHNIFPTFEKGLRAGIITLRTYWVKHQKRSIAAILSRWAPASDTIGSLPGAPPNSPVAYSNFVAKRMHVSPVAQLRLFDEAGRVIDPIQLYDLVAAMAAYENHADLKLPRYVFNEALALV